MENDILIEHEVVLEQLEALLQGTIAPVVAAKKCEKIAIQTSVEYLLNSCRDLLATLQCGNTLADHELQPLLELLQGSAQTAAAGDRNNELVTQLHAYYQYLVSTYKIVLAPNNANALLILEGVLGGWVHMFRMVRANTARPAGLLQG